MLKKISLSLLLGSLFIVPAAMAASQTGTAQVTAFSDPTITEDIVVEFGLIPPTVGTTCSIDVSGALTAGPCLGTQAAGQFTISALLASSALTLTVTGASSGGSEVTYVASASAADGTTTLPLTDGAGSTFTTTGVPADIVITTFGSMSVNSALTPGVQYQVTYTVDVVYN